MLKRGCLRRLTGCATYKKKVKAVLACDKSLIGLINGLGVAHFKLVVLSPLNFVPNATVAYGKNSALYMPTYRGALTQAELDTFVSRYFMHELGHSLGLRDEYARQRPQEAVGDPESAAAASSNAAFQPARPNCAPSKDTASSWWGAYVLAKVEGVGFFPGCAGNSNYYMPVQGTLMSDNPTLETYGRVSQDYLRGVIDCFYAGKQAIGFTAKERFAGQVTSCQEFKQAYPDFWTD